jgi:hypothetical protein
MASVFPGTNFTRIHRGQLSLAPSGTDSIFERIHFGRLRLGTQEQGAQGVWTAEGTRAVWIADNLCKILTRSR